MPDAMIKELDSVVLTTDLPEHGLSAGDIGTVCASFMMAAKGCTVEFMTLAGRKPLLVVTPARPIRFGRLPRTKSPHARRHVMAAAP